MSATPTSGRSPLTVSFDGRGSSDPDPGDSITYSWDLNGDGVFGDATTSTASSTYPTSGVYTAALRVTDSHGASSTATTLINVDNSLPVPVIDTPAPSLTWAVGDTISFSGHATDSTGALLPASGLTWSLVMHHCPSNCHTHYIQSFSGVSSGSFAAPDHDYPSYLELILTATDSSGRQASTSVDPSAEDRRPHLPVRPDGAPAVRCRPSAGTRAVHADRHPEIDGDGLGGDAPDARLHHVCVQKWSDGGAASHNIVAPASPVTLTATYAVAVGTTSYLSDLAYVCVGERLGTLREGHEQRRAGRR